MKKSGHHDVPARENSPAEYSVLSPEELPQAVGSLARSQGWEAGLALETAHWDRYVATHPEALLAAIKALPGETFVEVPSMLVAANYLQHVISGADPSRFHDFAHDDRGRSSRERSAVDRLIASAGRTAGHRTAGRLIEAAQSAIDGRQALERLSNSERAQLHTELPHLLIQWGRAFELADSAGAREYEESWELANLSQQPGIARRAAASLAWVHADHGRLDEADRWILRASRITGTAPRYDAPLHLASALTAIDRLDRDSTARHLKRLESVPIGEYWAAEVWVRAWAAETMQDAVRVEQRMNAQLLHHSEQLSTNGAYQRHLTSARARLATTRDKPAPQLPAVDKPSPFDHVMAAAAAYRSGKMHVVLRNAARALRAEQSPRMQTGGLLLTAAARLSLGREAAASEAFITANVIIEDQRLLSAYSIIAPEHLVGLAKLTGTQVNVSAARPGANGPSDNAAALGSLTRRERQVLTYLVSDHSLKAIAQALYISPNTVKGITTGLYRKIGVHSRQEAADIAHRVGLA